MTALFDASALLALLYEEQGAEIVEKHVDDAAILSVNLAEVVGLLARRGMHLSSIDRAIAALGLRVSPFTAAMAWRTGAFRAQLSSALGVADCCCLAAASILALPAFTADAAWRSAAPIFGVDVRLIR